MKVIPFPKAGVLNKQDKEELLELIDMIRESVESGEITRFIFAGTDDRYREASTGSFNCDIGDQQTLISHFQTYVTAQIMNVNFDE